MKLKDELKVLLMLAVAGGVVALYCYARVDLGMSLEQINAKLQEWQGTAISFTALIWLQIIVALGAGLGYRIWRHRVETAGNSKGR